MQVHYAGIFHSNAWNVSTLKKTFKSGTVVSSIETNLWFLFLKYFHVIQEEANSKNSITNSCFGDLFSELFQCSVDLFFWVVVHIMSLMYTRSLPKIDSHSPWSVNYHTVSVVMCKVQLKLIKRWHLNASQKIKLSETSLL